jgi:hypothetical protein
MPKGLTLLESVSELEHAIIIIIALRSILCEECVRENLA